MPDQRHESASALRRGHTHDPAKVVELYDSLTGLLSRKYFFHLVNNEIEKCRSEHSRFALVIIDIVGFRRVNLATGLDAGDTVLRETGRRLRGALRACDSVARMGNGEFAALLPSMISEDHPTLAINKLLGAFQDPFEVAGLNLNIDLRFGVALFPDTCANTDQLVRHATMALLHATERGRPFSVYYGGAIDTDLADYAHALELRSAVEQNQLILHYQPKWDVEKEKITAAEALVRWPHRDHGLIGPSKFIPVAEEGNLIRPLTSWVINEAVRQCAAWHGEGLKLEISANVSAKLLHDPELLEIVKNALDIWSLPPEYLTLEVTETAIMQHREEGTEILNQLAHLGILVSIDDFGTGYSSFAYLCDLPVKELKIDKSIVNSIRGNTDKETVLRTIIDLGHNLGLLVTAEGVEDEDKYRSLERLGCDIVQGFHISPPLTAKRLTSLVRTGSTLAD
jgi:diguanylate cyclase (GGDEF)-like protein